MYGLENENLNISSSCGDDDNQSDEQILNNINDKQEQCNANKINGTKTIDVNAYANVINMDWNLKY